MESRSRIGLILGGGGSRAGYQVGALKAIAEMLPDDTPNPFPVICGSSAGSINAAVVAAYALRFREGIGRLVGVWENFEVDKVFRADPWSALSRGGRWLLALMVGGLGRFGPSSLLDNTPLRELIEQHVPFDRIDQAIHAGALTALCVTACSYTTGRSVSFFHGKPELQPWNRTRRTGRRERIHIDHLSASVAIPIIFPAIRIGTEYFGDGSMRNTAPISSALHLGADKVLIIGLRQEPGRLLDTSDHIPEYPSVGQIAGYILDTLFLNSLYADIERLQRINETLALLPESSRNTSLRHVETLVISPSEDIAAIAQRYYHYLPKSVKYMFRALGAREEHGDRLLSYLLFVKPFCQALVRLGYEDTMAKRKEVQRFLSLRS